MRFINFEYYSVEPSDVMRVIVTDVVFMGMYIMRDHKTMTGFQIITPQQPRTPPNQIRHISSCLQLS